MIRVVLIGSGNLAYNLHLALLEARSVELVQIVARNPDALREFRRGPTRSPLDKPLPPADVYLLALADRAIEPVSRALRYEGGLVVHTSGAQPLSALCALPRAGVFYPLQSFSKDRPIPMDGVPVLLEATAAEDLKLLHLLAAELGSVSVPATSSQRLSVHLSAVFANNFTNHLAYLATTLCADSGLDPEILGPLLGETFKKLEMLSPRDAQTGPARRGDHPTLEKHRGLLDDQNLRELYDQLTHSIQATYEKKL